MVRTSFIEQNSLLQKVLAPIEQASGLPNSCYVDAASFQLEQERLFARQWAAIGFASDVPEPGCVWPVSFLDRPLFMLRDRAGEVRVFDNVCQHRGMILIAEPKKLAGPITCPYHAWAYDETGQLRATPHAGGPDIHQHSSLDSTDISLGRVRSAVWQNVVWVNMSGTAPDFDEFAAGLKARWAEFEQPGFCSGADSIFELEVACNWKLAVENYCEAYHLPFIHPDLNSYSKLSDHYNILEAGCAGQGTKVYNPQITADGRRFDDFANLSEKWDSGAEYCALFPNVLYGVHRDHSFAIILIPQGQQKTLERVAISYASSASTGPDFAPMRQTNSAMWKQVFEEDISVVEGMQKGRFADSFDGGRFSAVMDAPTHHFHRWAAAHLLAEAD